MSDKEKHIERAKKNTKEKEENTKLRFSTDSEYTKVIKSNG